MSHRDVPAACLGVLLPPARAPAMLGSGVCASDWRPESCRTTAQAGQWVALPPGTGWPSGVHPAHAAITRSRAGARRWRRAVWRWTARIHLEFIRMTGNLNGD
eukprot:COSAG02_NODE_1498_length_12281_cov_14.846741_8_plen_103_part_00